MNGAALKIVWYSVSVLIWCTSDNTIMRCTWSGAKMTNGTQNHWPKCHRDSTTEMKKIDWIWSTSGMQIWYLRLFKLITACLLSFRCQLDLFSCMCYGRQYLAIPPIKDQLPISLVLRCMKNTNLPFTLRASFCHIMLCVHLDTIPNELITPVELARLWNEIPEKLSLSKCSSLDRLV